MARSFFVGIACLCFASTTLGQNSDWEHVRPIPPSASTTPDEEAPFVGITKLRAACDDVSEEGCMKKLKMLEAVDADPYVTGEIRTINRATATNCVAYSSRFFEGTRAGLGSQEYLYDTYKHDR